MKKDRRITRIFDCLYDVTDFTSHPGGATALSLCVGRDATELFHSSHQFADAKKIELMMNKYRIAHTAEELEAIPASGVYDWKATLDSPFYRELRTRCDPIFASAGSTKQDWYRTVEVSVLFLVMAWQYWHFYQGYWHAILTFPTALWLFIVNMAHDASHFAVSKKPWVNDLFCELMNFNIPIYFWFHQHIIGHHNFPNVVRKDPDIHVAKIFRHHKDDILRPIHKYQQYFFPFMYLIRFPASYIVQTVRLVKATDFLGLMPLVPVDGAFRAMLLLRAAAVLTFMYVLPVLYHGWTAKGTAFALVPLAVFSLHSFFSTAFNHQHPLNDEQFHPNYYIHQILTGHCIDSSGLNYWVYIYTGGLNYQLEHHVFPTVNHCHLHRVRPIVRELCKKYNIQYNISPNIAVAVAGMYAHMAKMSTLTSDLKDE